MHYEAGALSKSSDDGRIAGLLLQGLSPTQVPPPLGHFQHVEATKEGLEKLLRNMNEFAEEGKLSEEVLSTSFNRAWPEFESAYKSILAQAPILAPMPKRPLPDMVEELLQIARAMQWETRKMPAHVERTLGYVEAHYRQLEKDMTRGGEGLPPAPKRPPIPGVSVTAYSDGRVERKEVPSNRKKDVFD